MKIAVTGHTNIELPFNLKYIGDKYNETAYKKCYTDIKNKLFEVCNDCNISFEDLTLISGMARGADEILAHIAIDNNLKLIISVPHSVKWHRERKLKKTPDFKIQAIEYDKILSYKKLIEIIEVQNDIDNTNYGFFLSRNQNMVDISDGVISWKRNNSKGTSDCIDRAKLKNKYFGNS